MGPGVLTVAAASLRSGTADLQRKNLVKPRAAGTGSCWGFGLAAPMSSMPPAPGSWSVTPRPEKTGTAAPFPPLSCVPGKAGRTSPPLTQEYGEPDQEGRRGEDEPPVADGLVVWGEKERSAAAEAGRAGGGRPQSLPLVATGQGARAKTAREWPPLLDGPGCSLTKQAVNQRRGEGRGSERPGEGDSSKA